MKNSILTILIIFLFSDILLCKVLKVPQDYTTIQSAINASTDLDTVLVSEGTYFENVKYNGKNIVLASNYIFTKDFETIRKTIINGSKSTDPDSGSCVSFNKKENSNAVLQGFTLTGGFGTKYGFSFGPYQEGGGVILGYSSAVIKDNIIINNNIAAAPGASNGGGGGIASMYGNPTICNNIIASNNAGYAGGIVLNWSSGKIMNNIIYHNTGGASFGTGGIMIWEPTTDVTVVNNTIVGNISLKDAGGININSTISVVKNNIVWGNRQVSGPQVTNASRGKFNNIEDYSDASNISANPLFLENSFLLPDNSPCVDAGDPADSCNDLADQINSSKALNPSKGSLKNDIGAFGGNFAKILPELDVTDLYVSNSTLTNLRCEVNKEVSGKVYFLNLSTGKLNIDSVTHTNKTDYLVNYPGKTLSLFQQDTLKITFKPTIVGNITDTIKIYHRAKDAVNPIKINVRSKANAATDVKENKSIGYNYQLDQNFPNPFNPETRIQFSIKESGSVTLKIYNILGKEIETLISKEMNAGAYSVNWKPEGNISSGVYLFKLTSGSFSEVKKMLFQK